MARVHYRPSTAADAWRIAVDGEAVAMLPASVSDLTVEAVWRGLGTGGIAALLDAITGAFGTSLTAIPPFALATGDRDGVRVAVRGALRALVEHADGSAEELSGQDVATWTERLIPQAARVTVNFEAAAGDRMLPISSGVVPAAEVVIAFQEEAPVVRVAPMAAPPAAVTPAAVPEPDPEPTPDAGAPEPTPEPAPVAAPEPATPPVPPLPPVIPVPEPSPAPAAVSGLISGVPSAITDPPAIVQESAPEHTTSDTWLPDATQAPGQADAAPEPASEAAAADLAGEDFDWRETVARPAAPAASPASDPADEDEGDHDGHTIASAALRALRTSAQTVYESTDDVPPRRPPRGRIRLSTGRVVELDRPVVIGRRPKSPRASGADLPTLVTVDGPQQDISRSHVEIRAEGEHVLVTDLHTTNGTVLLRGGQDPVRLHPGEPTMVVTDDVLDLGDAITVTFEGLP